MPRLDGLELCRRLRGASEELPIIFLTSRDEEFDRVLGLELGADDYLCKPFSMRELVARVRVLFRRAALRRRARSRRARASCAPARCGLDLERYEARWRERPVPLTVTEFRLLHALARHPGHVKTREQLLAEAYPEDAFVTRPHHRQPRQAPAPQARGRRPGFDAHRDGLRPRLPLAGALARA